MPRPIPAVLLLAIVMPCLSQSPTRAQEQTPAPTTGEIDERLRILERQREIEAEQAAEKAKTAAVASAGKDGFSLKSADGDWALRLGGYVQLDGRFISNQGAAPGTDTFVLRRVRPIFEGTLGGRFDFRIMPDFGMGQTVLQDAYADVRLSSGTKLQLGKFKSPFGLERLQSARDIEFVERALPTNLVPNRDLGIMGHAELSQGAFAWQLGVFNGVPDGGSADVDNNDGKDVIGRVFVKPFHDRRLEGSGFGVAASAGSQGGQLASTGLAPYRTASQQVFFVWRTGATLATTVVADGRRARVSPQAWIEIGRFGLMAEYVVSRQDVLLDTARDTLDSTAWQATVSFVLTGEDASFKGISPRRPLGQGPGAWEVVARAGALRIDDAAFPVYANPDVSARRAQEIGIGLNGVLTRNVRVMADLLRTNFAGGAAGGADRDDEILGLTRFQIAF
jgi:phosphate-selective porin OprO and OprP